MSYRCRIGAGVPGLEPGPARVSCDAPACETRVEATGWPDWLRRGKRPAAGWETIARSDGTRHDLCPEHAK